ncbi:hypothetical protein HMPREF9120_02786 [Neisseria sp. oral taxon 020 str. F0370]|nr:hypothetical protein HMPREF9120_02786 [Neisseria sp. oral taxon 020 str. F0370]
MNGTAAPNIKRPSENRFYGLSDGLRHSGRAYRPPSASIRRGRLKTRKRIFRRPNPLKYALSDFSDGLPCFPTNPPPPCCKTSIPNSSPP